MRRPLIFRFWPVLLGLALLAGLGLQAWLGLAEREELARLRGRLAERARLEAAVERLRAERPGEVELELLRAEAAEAPVVATELAAARRRLAEVRKLADEKRAAFAHFPAGTTIPASAWRKVGAADPAKALETVLWAAAAGDAAVFGGRLRFVAGAEPAGALLLEALPPALRATVRTPEEAVALLTLPDVPTGAVEVLEWSESPGLYQQVLVRLASPDGPSRPVRLLLGRADDGWRLLVTLPVVQGCLALLAAEAQEAEPAPTTADTPTVPVP